MRKNWLIDRRTCLKGLGAALALPLLETMGWAEKPAAGGYKPPLRLGFFYMPYGIWGKTWWPEDPATYPVVLPKALEPLRPVIDQCLLVDGLDNVSRDPLGNAAHGFELSTWLTAQMISVPNKAKIDIATSIDQLAAKHIGLYTPIPSLELETQSDIMTGIGQEGINVTYYQTLSFSTPTTPCPTESNPANVYKRLFSSRKSVPQKRGAGPKADAGAFAGKGDAPAAEGESLDRSMLDLILGGAKDLRGRVSANDQRSLDSYLDSVSSLEKRVVAIQQQQAEAAREAAGKGAKGKADFKSSPPIEVKVPAGQVKWSEKVKVMGDLITLAFQTDTTRVASMIFSRNNGINYPELPFSDHHHELSHHDGKAEKTDKLTVVDRFNVEQFAYIIARMHALKEGPGTLLDNCILMGGSGMGDGSSHSPKRMPTILAGKGGGTIRPGRYLKGNGNHGDLLTAIIARTGLKLDKPIGIGTKLLEGLV